MTTVSDRLAAEELRRKLIPPLMRGAVEKGGAPLYRVNRPDFDRLPLGTFIIVTTMGTGGRMFEMMMRTVKPNQPMKYAPKKRTPDGRLLYVFWASGDAVKILADVKGVLARHIILPTDPQFAGMDAFKIACDTKRSWSGGKVPFKPTMAYRVLGIEPLLPLDTSSGPAIVTP